MKYIKKFSTNLISFVLAFVLLFSMSSCSDENVEESISDFYESSENSDVISETTFDSETALKLVENDRKVTEIFICNALCDDTMKNTAEYSLVSNGEYSEYVSIEALLDSTYLQQSGEIGFFKSYPLNTAPSVKNQNGKTAVLYHSGIGYTDFIDTTTITVCDTERDDEKLIKAKSLSGKSVELKAVFSNEQWLLERGIFKMNPVHVGSFDGKSPFSKLGSASSFSNDILVIELFISDRESGFSKEEEEQFHEKISSSVDFLAKKSEEYGNEINITYEKMYFDHENTLENSVIHLDIMLAETGFGTLEEFAKASFNIYQYDNYFFVVCLNKEFDSSAGIYDGTDNTNFYRAERAVVGKDFSQNELCKSVLEIFGNMSFDGYFGQLYKTYFPNAVELSNDLDGSTVSPITAFCCGFLKDLASVYHIFLK